MSTSAALQCTSLLSVLAWIRGSVPRAALLAAPHATGFTEATVSQAIETGHIIEDSACWLRLSPFVSASRDEADRPLARDVLDVALRLYPANLDFHVSRLFFVEQEDAPAVADLLERMRVGQSARALAPRLLAADLLPRLYALCPQELLALLIQGGHVAEARPMLAPTDRWLHAMAAIEEGEHAQALTILDGCDETRECLVRAHALRQQFDYEGLSVEVERLALRPLRPIDAFQVAYHRHRVATFRYDEEGRNDALRAMQNALCASTDGGLRCRVEEACLADAVRRGEVAEGLTRLATLQRLVSEGWAPGLRSQLSLYDGFLADLSGDHLRLAAALAQPFYGESDGRFRRLQQAALLAMQGQVLAAIATPEVQAVGGMAAQFLAEVGRYREALQRLDAHSRGYGDIDLAVLRGPIASRLGQTPLLRTEDTRTPYQHAKVCWSNTLVCLRQEALQDARDWAAQGAKVAQRHQLWELGARLMVLRADIAARLGSVDDALTWLDRFDALQRHHEDFLVNRASAARAYLGNAVADDGFTQRVTEQQDVETLAILRHSRPLGRLGEALLADLDPEARRQLGSAFVTLGRRPRLVVAEEGRLVTLPDGETVDFRRYGSPRRVLLALVDARLNSPGEGVDIDELIEQGWPGERILWDAARTRLYSVMRRLRRMGLTCIETVDEGYRLCTDWDIQRIER